MFGDTIVSALSSLAPFWSNEIVKSFSLGNEYTMAINMILTETLKFLSFYLTDSISMILVTIVTIIMLLKSFGINIINFNNLIKTCNSITVIGSEKVSNGEISVIYSKAFKSVNLMLIKKYGIKKLRYLNDFDFDILVDDCSNFKLENDLHVTVKRETKESIQRVAITLMSYSKDINIVIKDAIDSYDDDDKVYKLKFIGTETKGTTYLYSEAMKCLTYVLVNTYKMNKLKILTEIKEDVARKEMNSSQTDKKENMKNAGKTSEETQNESLDDLNKKFKNIFLLENCKNHLLEEDVWITIERSEETVTYTLFSNTTNLKDFLKKCIDTYKIDISTRDYKYRIKLTGLESISHDRSTVKYSKNLIALCNKLIDGGHVNNFKLVESDKQTIKLIDNISNLVVDDILINTITSIQTPSYWESYISTTYILESNTVDLVDYVEQCEKDYDEYLNKKNTGTIYYFKYLGKFGNDLKFSKSVLSSSTNPLHETFDNIYNEHSEKIKEDILMLKDLEYYKRTGLRRKKSYLFYGEPGCGKNATVVAMALFDCRHIIDIPFSILQYNSEFHEIMNLTSINGISFRRDQIIIMFDEMHTGLAKMCKGDLKKQNAEKDEEAKSNDIIAKIATPYNKKEPTVKLSHDTLDLGCVLSLLDGIGNYGGVIYAGLTNYIERIPGPLKRSLRLTPVYFTYLRQSDAIALIEKFFSTTLDGVVKLKIPDRKMTPARLRVLCEQHSNLADMNQFIDIVISESELESRENYCETDNTEKYLKASVDSSGDSGNKRGKFTKGSNTDNCEDEDDEGDDSEDDKE